MGLGYLSIYMLNGMPAQNLFSPELFQHLNPFFIVALTPVAVAVFSWMNKKVLNHPLQEKLNRYDSRFCRFHGYGYWFYWTYLPVRITGIAFIGTCFLGGSASLGFASRFSLRIG